MKKSRMHAIMGGTGHVGAAVAEALLARDEHVLIITRDAGGAARWSAQGADIVEATAEDVDSLRAALRRAKRAFLLNPPADVSKDTDRIERRTVANILEALKGSDLEKVVAASTGGAQEGARLGDLSVLWELETGLQRQPIPAAIHRGAYYMSNWDGLLDQVKTTGKLSTTFPADMAIPMVAPKDLGHFGAERLLTDSSDTDTWEIEGPARYTVQDVADCFSRALGRTVHLDLVPRDQWKDAFLALGFSEPAAESYTRMTEVSVDSGFAMSGHVKRGRTTLDDHIGALVSSRDQASRSG